MLMKSFGGLSMTIFLLFKINIVFQVTAWEATVL
jgi:hypothetical protein